MGKRGIFSDTNEYQLRLSFWSAPFSHYSPIHTKSFFLVLIHDETKIALDIAVRLFKNFFDEYICLIVGQAKKLYKLKLMLFVKYGFNLAKAENYKFKTFSEETDIRLALLQTNKDCVGNFSFLWTNGYPL